MEWFDMVYVPVGNKWVNLWFWGDKEFYRYIIKYAEVVDEDDEEEIAEVLKKLVKKLIEEGTRLTRL